MTMQSPIDPAQRKGRMAIIALVAGIVLVSGFAIVTNLSRLWSLGPEQAEAGQTGLEPLTIVTASGPHAFKVEVMRTDRERARGLMERRFLPPDRGMLFDFKQEQQAIMWMKNTYIPLDMVFIRKDGTVHRVEANTEPLSERTIDAGAPVLSVLELNAGAAAKIDIRPGDKIRHPLFGN